MEDGSVGKAWTLCLIHLGSSLTVNSPSLVSVHKGWLAGFNLIALSGASIAQLIPIFSLPKKEEEKVSFMKRHFIIDMYVRGCH